MNGFLMSLGGYISHKRCCVGEFNFVAETFFFVAIKLNGLIFWWASALASRGSSVALPHR